MSTDTLTKYSINIIGSGNVAHHLSKAFADVGCKICGIWNRHHEKAVSMANCYGASSPKNLKDLPFADFWIICVKDDAIREVAKVVSCIMPRESILLHSSGSTSIAIFDGLHENSGVLYPLQTFSKDIKLDISDIPFFIEGTNEISTGKIRNLVSRIAKNIEYMPSDKRKYLHLAAVFACNFTNFCYSVAQDILASNEINKDFLLPLIDQTANKMHFMDALSAQTGPAVRFDEKTIGRHLEIVPEQYKKIYIEISKHIHALQKARNNR